MKTLSVTTNINAPVSTVWRHLTTWSDFPSWNPFITSLTGDVAVGAPLEARIQPPGGKAMTFRPTVTAVEHERRLEWLGHVVVTGLFDGRHSFLLEDLGDGRTRLTQAERFTGLLVPLTGRMLDRTSEGFAAMNDALRRRAEQDVDTHHLPR
jgi:hypothetical protein